MATERLTTMPDLRQLYLRGLFGIVGKHGNRLPDRELVIEDVHVDAGELAAYDRVCGFRLTDQMAATYPHVLAFPLQVAYMADRSFPFPLPGMLHIKNVVSVLHPVDLAAPLALRVTAERCIPHDKGAQVDLVTRAEVDGALVWLDRSTYLAPGRTAPAQPDAEAITEPIELREREVPERTAAVWRLGRDVGRRYAKVSGDVNPIHLGRVRARLFGQRTPIAHGMWTKARCLAALEGRLPDTYTVDVDFKRPLRLPGTAEFASAPERDGWSFGVRSPDGIPHLVGRLRER